MKHKAHYLSNLTPLRGIAALMVAVFHFETTVAYFVKPQQSMIIAKSYLLVDLFFLMSGFIMVHVYCDFFQQHVTGQAFKKFAVARFARVYPMHLFTLLLLVGIVLFLESKGMPPNPLVNLWAIPTNLLLLQSFGIHTIFTWNVPSWSISAEWWAYMVFPFLVLFINKRKQVATLTLLVFVIAAYLSILFWLPRYVPFHPDQRMPHDLNTTYDFGFLRGLAGFVAGMLLYQVYQLPRSRNFFRHDALALFCIAALIFCMHIGINDGLYIILFAATILCFSCNGGYLYKACNLRLPQYLGKISYSIYMMQSMLLLPFAAGATLPGEVQNADGSYQLSFSQGLLFCFTYLLLLIGIASLTYYILEQPLRKRLNKGFAK